MFSGSLLLLLLLVLSTADHALANRVEVRLLYGDVSGSVGQSGSSRNKSSIAAGSEVVVECAGQWRQEVDVTASFLRDGSHWFDLRRDGFAGGQRFRFTPKVEDYSRRTQVKCEVKTRQGNHTWPGNELLSSDKLDVIVVFPPQPKEDQFVPVEGVGQRGEAKLTVRAQPLVREYTLEWETPVNFKDPITTSSRQPGYRLVTRKVSESELEVQLVIERMTVEDFGAHTITLRNQLGRQTYKVRFFEPEVARVFISPLPKEVVIGKPNIVRCTSDGGSPPPVLEARVEVHGKQSHRLTPTGNVEGRGSHLEQSFKLDPRVSERTDRHTFAVCEAVQRAGGNNIYEGVTAQEQLNIFYPPQPQEIIYVTANENETAVVTLMVSAFPRPRRQDIKWSFAENESEKYKMEVTFPDAANVKLTMTVVRVEEHDFSLKHSVSVQNKYGTEVYHIQVLKPIQVWMIVLIVLGVLAVLAAIVAIPIAVSKCGNCNMRKRKASSDAWDGSSQPQPKTPDNTTPFLAESAT